MEISSKPTSGECLPRTTTLKLRNSSGALTTRRSGLTALSRICGIGKPELDKALTGDEVVRQALPDDIVWSTAGEEI